MASLTVLPWRIAPALNRALLSHTTRAFQKELLALSPTQPADRPSIFCHAPTPPLPQRLKYDLISEYFAALIPPLLLDASALRRSTPVMWNGCHVTDEVDAQAGCPDAVLAAIGRRFAASEWLIHARRLDHSHTHRPVACRFPSPSAQLPRLHAVPQTECSSVTL